MFSPSATDLMFSPLWQRISLPVIITKPLVVGFSPVVQAITHYGWIPNRKTTTYMSFLGRAHRRSSWSLKSMFDLFPVSSVLAAVVLSTEPGRTHYVVSVCRCRSALWAQWPPSIPGWWPAASSSAHKLQTVCLQNTQHTRHLIIQHR